MRPVVVIGDALLDVDVDGTRRPAVPGRPRAGARRRPASRPGPAAPGSPPRWWPGAASRCGWSPRWRTTSRARGCAACSTARSSCVAGPATGGTVVKCRLAGRRAVAAAHRPRRRPPGRRLRARLATSDAALAGAGAVLVSDYGRGVRRRPGGARRARAGRRPPGAGGVGPAPARGRSRCPASRSSRRTSPRPAGAAGGRRGRDRSARGAGARGADLLARWDVRAVAVTLGQARRRRAAPPRCLLGRARARRGRDRPVRCRRPLRRRGRRPRSPRARPWTRPSPRPSLGAAGFVARGGGATVRRVGDALVPARERAACPAVPGRRRSPAWTPPRPTRPAGAGRGRHGGRGRRLVRRAAHRPHRHAWRPPGRWATACSCSSTPTSRCAGAPARTAPGAARGAARRAGRAGLRRRRGRVRRRRPARGRCDALRPDLWVKGGDHDPADLPETPLVRSWGGEVVVVPYRPARTPMAARTPS